ncbi:MAG: fibrobacter succinogenes major paralogous domain-containing protein [Chitinispirillales bacterium]|jgi:uncharacterized protein (TIGR02145 family)|nr:fibrobacter succinogenes major paralogous domain-containing protein [Chitinispirillales bacterium]
MILPSADEWQALVDAVGGRGVAGSKLKSQTGWNASDDVVNEDAYGFSALPGGIYGIYNWRGGGFREAGYDSYISSGGETQLVYVINSKGGISSVHSGNKCASGTGEFFLQQIRRMGLTANVPR